MIRRDYVVAGLAAAGLAASVYEIRRLRHEVSVLREEPAPAGPPRSALLAAVELGGTTVRCGVAYFDSPTTLVDATEIATRDPQTTMRAIVMFLDRHAPFVSLGIASFGPVQLDVRSPRYGFITNTPKTRWRHFNLLRHFAKYDVPTAFDTDVNAPALAELRVGGHGSDATSVAFITVGTGIGVGLVVNGDAVHGLVHPEGGHVLVRGREGDHAAERGRPCVEDVACAGAIAERVGLAPNRLHTVPDSHPVWDDVAHYLAQLCLTITYMVSPHVIVLSGGVLTRQSLFPRIRKHFATFNAGYIAHPRVTQELDKYIVPSRFGNSVGIIGALELARRAALRTDR